MINLHIVDGPKKGKTFEVKATDIDIGRAPGNHVQIKDISVSRRHLRIQRIGDKYFVEDVGSSNGTYVKGKRIKPRKAVEVEAGTPIAIGKTVLSLGLSQTPEIRAGKPQARVGIAPPEVQPTPPNNRPMTPQKNMDLVYKVSQAVKEPLHINEILEVILSHVFALFKRIERGVFIMVDDRSGEWSKAIIRFKKDVGSDTPMFSRSIVDKVIREREPVIILNTLNEDDANLSKSMRIMQVKSVICVPLISRSKVRGVIYLDSLTQPFGFRQEDVTLITALSASIALAIENAGLYSQLERLDTQRVSFEEDLAPSESLPPPPGGRKPATAPQRS